MINNIKKKLKKHTKIRKILKTIINHTYTYVKNGYYKNMFFYFVKYSRSEKNALRKYGLKKCIVYKTHSWRYNDGIDHVYRRYYLAYLNGKKAFVKICKNDSTAQNEIMISKYLLDFDMPFLAKAEAFSIDFNGGYNMLAIEYCKDMKPFFIPKTIEQFSDFCEQFLNILEKLNEALLIHADIHKNNLMIDCNNKLKLIDFGISSSKNIKNSVNYLARPGTYYVQNDNTRIYDDAYSFVKMVENLTPSQEFVECDEYKKINERINKFYISIDMQQFA